MVNKSKELVKKLPIIKPHLDLLAAVLTIPVLITVFILNFSTITKGKSTLISPTPTATIAQKSITVLPVKPHYTTPSPTDSPSCNPAIGPISITDPSEGDTITTNPVCISIDYQAQGYCSIVWAYKINGGALSDYSNNSVCLYNMPAGQVSFELYVKSLVNNQTKILKRTFQYTPIPTASPTPTPMLSATLSPTPTTNP